MTCSRCAEVWQQAAHKEKAAALDAHSPNCGCEAHSFAGTSGKPVANEELIVRVVTSPDGYDMEAGELLTSKLTALFSSGVSIIRQGASDDEIKLTVQELTSTAEPRSLIGAVIVQASQVRFLDQSGRSYCVYDTPDRGKTHHADLMCTMPNQGSNSEKKRLMTERRHALKELFMNHLVRSSTVEDLIAVVRQAENENTAGVAAS